MDFFTSNRELKFNKHYFEESEAVIDKKILSLSGIISGVIWHVKCLELNCVCERFGD